MNKREFLPQKIESRINNYLEYKLGNAMFL